MNPTSSQVHVDSALTNISVAFLQSADKFVAGQVFPNVAVGKQSDRYFVYDRGDFNRDEAEKRAPSTESSGSGFDLDNTPTFFCDVYAHHKDISDQIASNADMVLNLQTDATNFVMHKMLIKREKTWASDFFTTGVWTTDITGVSATPSSNQVIQWSDTTSGDPIGNIRAAITAVEQSTGFTPNTMTIGKQVLDALEDHPDIVDRIKYSGMTGAGGNPARVNEQTLAQLFGLERILVMRAIENTADRGQTNSHSFIGGKNALLTYTPPSAGILLPSAGYTFSWQGYLGTGNPNGIAISRFRMDNLRSERVEGEMAYDQKLVAADLGYFFSGIVA